MTHEILTSKDVTWINSEEGECIARFGKFGWEINRSDGIRINYGSLDANTNLVDWAKFGIWVRFALNINLLPQHKPERLR